MILNGTVQNILFDWFYSQDFFSKKASFVILNCELFTNALMKLTGRPNSKCCVKSDTRFSGKATHGSVVKQLMVQW